MSDVEKPYTAPDKVEACMALIGGGYNSFKISELTGVPASTIRTWQNSPAIVSKYGEIIKAGRERLAYKWTMIADKVTDDIIEGRAEITPVAAMTGFGIITDKVQKDGGGSGPTFMVRVRTAAGDIIETGVKQ